MRLPQPFYRLPLRFDAERLAAEIRELPSFAWAQHPNNIDGNSSLRLISANGGENDEVNGVMLPTPHLERAPYIRQILSRFGVVWGRSRLMRLAQGAQVPPHADINYHWFNRVRLHIPIITRPEVRFYCDDVDVHMAAGEAWVFDNWRKHRVINPTDQERIHLVADTSGSAAFWRLVYGSQHHSGADESCPFDPKWNGALLTERTSLAPIMSPAEIDLLILDLRAELISVTAHAEASPRLARYHAMLESFCRDWRQLYLLYGTESQGWSEFEKLRDSLRELSRELTEGLVMRTNGVAAHTVLEGRVLRVSLSLPNDSLSIRAQSKVLSRPIFIVGAPRSGTTLLFETLAASIQIATLGGEAHFLIEGIEQLQPGRGVDSNRLTDKEWTPEIAERIRAQIIAEMRDSSGRSADASEFRFLEKTPKNSLRIPFIDRLFPDALFIFLWRDPRENLSSIIEAWRSGKFKTYNGLPDFDGPWSLLLPPGWQAMNRKPLEEIAAFQWDTTNRIALDDLARLQTTRWTSVNYAEFIADPAQTIRRLGEFVGIDLDEALQRRVSAALPLSRHTDTPPAPEKWRRNEQLIAKVLPRVESTWRRLRSLG